MSNPDAPLRVDGAKRPGVVRTPERLTRRDVAAHHLQRRLVGHFVNLDAAAARTAVGGYGDSPGYACLGGPIRRRVDHPLNIREGRVDVDLILVPWGRLASGCARDEKTDDDRQHRHADCEQPGFHSAAFSASRLSRYA